MNGENSVSGLRVCLIQIWFVEIWNNKDNIAEAIHGFDIFTKNYCLNCKESEEKDDLIFRCKECPFISTSDGKCLIKKFAHGHKGNLDLSDFGAMGKS